MPGKFKERAVLYPMSYASYLRKIRQRTGANRLPTTRIIALMFALIIVSGAALLMLPIASRDAQSCGVMKALFTATSATCVTGLVLEDTFVQWSGFGQVVIIVLIQIGGLGFMSIASIFVFTFRKKLGMKGRMLLAQAMSLNDVEGILRLQRHVLVGSFSIEAVGALVLFLRFLPEFGWANALKWGVFHSISAFCNAGFDLFGVLQPGSSLTLFATDWTVCLTVMALVHLGGLGFFVWEELWQKLLHRKEQRLSAYTKLVLVCSLTFFLGGCVVIGLLEWNNPLTIGSLPWYDKLLAAAFQATTLRTAGFATLDQGALTEATRGFSAMYMLIGGSSGSTAGGLKTVTVALLILGAWAGARGRSYVTVFKRTVPEQNIRNAMSLALIVLFMCIGGAVVLVADSGVAFVDALFETASALATVGVTANITPLLGTVSKILLIVFMYFGRVGILTLSLGFFMGDRAEGRYRYAETKFMIG